MPNPSIFTSVINSYLPEPHASLLNGILFGVNLKAGKVFYDQLKIVGLLHLVVLSGINITMLGAITASLTHSFSKHVSILITILMIVLFIIFVQPKAPIVRAGFMSIFTLVAIIFGRKSAAIYSLFLSLLFIAFLWPKWLSTISLQLSYGATLGIILFANTSSKNALWKEFKTSLAAQVFTVPIIFFYFGQISLIAPISNILVSFAIYPLMIFGFLTAVLGKIHYLLGLLSSFICYGLLQYIVFIVETLSKIPLIYINFGK